MTKVVKILVITILLIMGGYFLFFFKTCTEMIAPLPLGESKSGSGFDYGKKIDKITVCHTLFEKLFPKQYEGAGGGQVTPGGNTNQPCIQVITPARNPKTGEIRDFPTPCDVPAVWEKI